MRKQSLLGCCRWIFEISHLLEDLQSHKCFFLHFVLLLAPFFPFVLPDMLVIEELNFSAVVIVSFSGWQRLVIILKCNNVNAICHDGV